MGWRTLAVAACGVIVWGGRAEGAPPTEDARDLPGPEGLEVLVVDGRLRLSLEEAVRLALVNNTGVRLGRLAFDASRFGVDRARSAFDPVLNLNADDVRANSPAVSQLDGAATREDRERSGRANLAETLPTGTRLGVDWSASRASTNSIYSTFNPSYSTNLTLSVSQSLFGARSPFATRAPLRLARGDRARARAEFHAFVNDSVALAVERYWSVVELREGLEVLRKSLDLAENTFKQNKRALELGALPPLDIFRSEAQVATRRAVVIQSQFGLKRAEDELRRLIGVDLVSDLRRLPLDLVETPAPRADPPVADAEQVLALARDRRPELLALRQQLANDEISLSVARSAQQPELSVSGAYSTRGRSGTELDPGVQPPAVLSTGGLGDALDQLRRGDFPTYRFGVQVRVPLPNRAARADVGNARVNREQTLYRIREREQAIGLEVQGVLDDLEKAKLSLSVNGLARDLARKNLEAEERKYELGAQTIFFVLDAQTQMADAELNLLRAQVDYQKAVTALDRVTGALAERHGGALLLD